MREAGKWKPGGKPISFAMIVKLARRLVCCFNCLGYLWCWCLWMIGFICWGCWCQMFGPVCICKGNSVLQMGAIPKTDDGGFHCERLRRHPTSMDHCLWISPSTHKMVQYSASAKHACVLEDSLQACVCVCLCCCVFAECTLRMLLDLVRGLQVHPRYARRESGAGDGRKRWRLDSALRCWCVWAWWSRCPIDRGNSGFPAVETHLWCPVKPYLQTGCV